MDVVKPARGRAAQIARRVMIGASLGLGALIVLAVTSVLIFGPRPTAAFMLRSALEASGLAPAVLDVSAIGFDAVELKDIKLGPHASLSAARVRVDFAGGGPLAGARMLIVDGLTFTARLDEKGNLDLGLGDFGRGGSGAGGAPTLPRFPITLNDTRLRLETPVGVLEAVGTEPALLTPKGGTAQFAISFAPVSGGPFPAARHDGSLSLTYDQALAYGLKVAFAPVSNAPSNLARLTVSGTAKGDVSGGPLSATLTLDDGEIPTLGAVLKNAVLSASRTAGKPNTELAVGLERIVVDDPAHARPPFNVGGLTLKGRLVEEATRTLLILDTCARADELGLALSSYMVNLQAPALCGASPNEPLLVLSKDKRSARASLPETKVFVSEVEGGSLLEGRLPQLSLAADLDADLSGTLTAQSQGGLLTLPAAQATLTAITLSGEAAIAKGALGKSTLRLNKALVSDMVQAPRFVPITLTGTTDIVPGEETERLVNFAFDASAEGAGVFARATGTHQLDAGVGSAEVRLPPLTFGPGGLAPERLLPLLRGQVTAAKGTLEGTAALTWGGQSLTSRAEVTARALGFAMPFGQFDGINGTVKLASLLPVTTASPQEIRIARMDVGLPLTDGVLRFSVAKDGTLTVHEARWPWIGGRVSVAATAFGGGRNEQVATFTVDDIDLAELLKLADVDGLSGTGRLSGEVPVTITRDHQFVKAGSLRASQAGGTLTYKGGVGSAATGANAGSAILFKALDGFQYKTLETTLDGDLAGTLSLQVHLKGSNPQLYDGYPIELNVSSDGPFVSMIRNGLFAYRNPAGGQ